jgi:cation diffusion facilitator family transporter
MNHPQNTTDQSQPRSSELLKQEEQAASRVTIIGMVLDAVLGLIKVVGGALFHSQALLVDGIHSFTDVASDLVVLVVMKLSRQAPDQNHPYGHQRIETMGTMILGSVLIAVGAALAWDNVLRVVDGKDLLVPGWPVLVAALASILGKEWIYRYTRHVGETIRSDLIIANAWHSRTDAFSSIIVLLSTAGAMLGLVWLDAVAAVAIAVIVARIGWKFTWDSVQELVDTGLSQEQTEKLRQIACETDGVRDVHELRSRRMGHDVFLDVHLVVRPEISVSEGHQIGMRVVGGMQKELDNLMDINFHIDAEDDEKGAPTSRSLPSRKEISEVLDQHLPALPHQSRMRLHYLKNHVHIEVFLESRAQLGDKTVADINRELETYPWFGSLKAWFSTP